MRQIFPLPAEPVDLLELYGRPPSGVRLSMISSVDGAASFGGRSGTLGGKADTELLGILRSVADVVLVAAGTVRAEHYGPAAVPIAVISRTCQLDFAAPLFTAATARSLVLTVSTAPADARARAAQVADLIVTGEHDLDLAAALRALAERGLRAVLAEGGPTLNGHLAAAGLIDELCLTVSPHLAGGEATRIVAGPARPTLSPLHLLTACEDEGFLFLRYAVERPAADTEPRPR